MNLSAVLAIELIAVCYLVCGAKAACSQDNCFRAMFPSTDPTRFASATSFCHTYTQGTATATTGFISRFTSACGSSPPKYSSACACIPTYTTSSITTAPTSSKSTTTTTTTSPQPCAPTPYETYQNGDFECGIYPWRALVTNGTIYTLNGPGFTGATAFQATQNIGVDTVGLGQALLTQLFYITPGTHYTLTFNSFWSTGYGGFIGVKLNGQPLYTVDASDKNGPGVWNSNVISFTAATGQYLLEFEFLFGSGNVFAKVDNVVLSPGK